MKESKTMKLKLFFEFYKKIGQSRFIDVLNHGIVKTFDLYTKKVSYH